ncbi:hypothetical protein KQI38_09685 [Tissierella carlieri]|uniref:hypothetical protein n=1 Tax=Tissierella carlieri TaxID=689904 RepID=UPI001C1203BC|nr:hypothetical protein [Tissierella carlieri]MBU5312299.1 hypothetical protein [Tissierella carlieri]
MNKKINSNLDKLTSQIMEVIKDEDKIQWNNYINALKKLTTEEVKKELKNLANYMVNLLETN